MRVTSIEQQKRRPGRKNIYVDGTFVLGVSDGTLLRTGLRSGDPVDPSKLQHLQDEEQRSTVRASAIRLIARRPRTEKELTERLRRNGYTQPDIMGIVAELKSAGILDDRAFARMYVRDQVTLRPAGRILLSRKLRQLGVSPEIISETLEEIMTGDTEEDAAEQAARKFLSSRSRRPVDPRTLRRRLVAFLTRRGFSWDTVRSLANSIVQENNDPA